MEIAAPDRLSRVRGLRDCLAAGLVQASKPRILCSGFPPGTPVSTDTIFNKIVQ